MTAPTCPKCGNTGSLSGDIDGVQDCTACDAVERREEMRNYLKGLSPLMHAESDAWAAYQFALSRPVAQEPVAYLRFRASQQWSGVGGHDIEHAEWMETCHAHEIGDDKLPAFPVYAAPVAAQPSEAQKSVDDVLNEMRHGGALYQPNEWPDAWHALRDDVLSGVDGLDNDQVNIVLGMLDQYEPVPYPTAAVSAAPSGEVERDAARYRWLRNKTIGAQAAHVGSIFMAHNTDGLDAAIDRAITATKE